MGLDHAGEDYQCSLAGNCGYAVECASDSDKKRLLVFRQGEHIEAVGSNVVSGRGESHEPEYSKGELKECRSRDGEAMPANASAIAHCMVMVHHRLVRIMSINGLHSGLMTQGR